MLSNIKICSGMALSIAHSKCRKIWLKHFVLMVNWPPQQLWCCLRHSVTVVTDPHKPWRVASPECQRFCPCLEGGHHHHCHHHPQHWHLKPTILFDGWGHNFRPNYSSPCCLGQWHSTNVISSIITLPRRPLCLLCSYCQGSSYPQHRHNTLLSVCCVRTPNHRCETAADLCVYAAYASLRPYNPPFFSFLGAPQMFYPPAKRDSPPFPFPFPTTLRTSQNWGTFGRIHSLSSFFLPPFENFCKLAETMKAGGLRA